MATHHGGTGQPLEETSTSHEQDTDIPIEYHHEDMDNFENVEHENHIPLKILTREFYKLWHRVETAEGQPTEAINQLAHELHRFSLGFHSSAQLEPLDEVLQ